MILKALPAPVLSLGAGPSPGRTKAVPDMSIYGPSIFFISNEEQQDRLAASRAKLPLLVVMVPKPAVEPRPPTPLIAPDRLHDVVEQNRIRIDAGRGRVDPTTLVLRRPVLAISEKKP